MYENLIVMPQMQKSGGLSHTKKLKDFLQLCNLLASNNKHDTLF